MGNWNEGTRVEDRHEGTEKKETADPPGSEAEASPPAEDIDFTWSGVRASWADAWKKTKLFARHLPEELLDAAEDAIQKRVESVKESVTSRVTRTRDRIKSAIARKKIRWLEFWKKVLFFQFFKKRLDRRIQRIEKSMAGNYVEELRRDIGNRLTGLEPTSTEKREKEHTPLA